MTVTQWGQKLLEKSRLEKTLITRVFEMTRTSEIANDLIHFGIEVRNDWNPGALK